MADEDLGGKLVFIVALLGGFILLVSVMPAEFYSIAPDYDEYYIPDSYGQFNLENLHFDYFENDTLLYFDSVDIDFNPEINYRFDVNWWSYTLGIDFWHWDRDWPVKTAHKMTIYNEPNDVQNIGKSDLEDNWDSINNQSVISPIWCNDISITALFADSDTNRNNITQAWDDGSLEVGIGFGYENASLVAMSGWDLVGRLLTFQSPDLGMGNASANTLMNGMIALPLWAMIAYLIYRLILLAIPFVG
jgi:hypothetical protein